MTATAADIAAHVLGELDRVGRFATDDETTQFVAVMLKTEYPDAGDDVVRTAIEAINKGVRESAESRRLGLRAIEPINTLGLDIGPPEHGEPICERVNPRDLFVDPLYQRNIGERGLRQIRRIVEGWDWNRFKPPICAYAEHDGKTVLKVLDGQHTAIAACSHKDIGLIPVMIVEAAETSAQASAFVGQNVNRLAVTALQLHRSNLIAEDGDAVVVDRICRRAGVKVLTTQPKRYNPGETVAIHAISQLVEKRGAIKAKAILEVVAKAGFAPITTHQIKAAEHLLTDDEFCNSINPDDLADAAGREVIATSEEAKRLSIAHKWPFWRALAIVWFRKTKKRRLTTGRVAA